MSTGFGHMEWHLVPHHPTHMDTKNLTARRVNLERRQASSYSLAKCHSASQVPVRLCAHPHHRIAHTLTHAGTFNPQWHQAMTGRQKGLALLSRSLPQHILYSSLPNPRAILYLHTQTGSHAQTLKSVFCGYSVTWRHHLQTLF